MKKLLAVVALAITLGGCGEDQILSGMQNYFPQAEVIPSQPAILLIDTHLTGMGQQFMVTMFPMVLQSIRSKYGLLTGAMIAGKHRFLVMVFNDGEWSVIVNMANGQAGLYPRAQAEYFESNIR